MMPTVMQVAAKASRTAGQNGGATDCVAGRLEATGLDSEIPCMACGIALEQPEFP